MRETVSKDKRNVWCWYNVATCNVEFVAARVESTYSSGETLLLLCYAVGRRFDSLFTWLRATKQQMTAH